MNAGAGAVRFMRGALWGYGRVAVHEAGHALAAIMGRSRFEYVTVIPVTGESDGHLHYGHDDDALRRRAREVDHLGQKQFLARAIRVHLGGMAAEMAVLNIFEKSTDDFNSAIAHAWVLMPDASPGWMPSGDDNDVPEPIQRYLRDTFNRLAGAFVKRSDALVCLADALEARKRLTWREAVDIAKGAA